MFTDPDACPNRVSEGSETGRIPYRRPGGRGLRYAPVQGLPDQSSMDDQATDESTREAREARQNRSTDG